MKSPLVRILVRILRVYVLLVVAVFISQRWLIYHPAKAPEPKMIADAQGLGLVPWKDGAGTIIGWKNDMVRPSKPANQLLVFHGNAGNALYRYPYVAGFESLDSGKDWEVTLFEYPGYGARSGSPNRTEFADAARAAIIQLTAMDDRPLYLLGESLGSGVACDMAAEQADKVRGLILVTPFARLGDVAQSTIPFLPARYLLRDRWDNVAALRSDRRPVAVLIAGCDEVVGCQQGEQLFASLDDRPKQRWFFPDAGHNSMNVGPSAAWWSEVSAFLLGVKR